MPEKTQTTVGLSKSTIATITLVVMVLASSMFWKDRGTAEATVAVTQDLIMKSHEGRITLAEKDRVQIKEDHAEFKEVVDERFDGFEKMQVAIIHDQAAILDNQRDFKTQLSKQNDLQIERLKADSRKAVRDEKLYEYLRSIETIGDAD